MKHVDLWSYLEAEVTASEATRWRVLKELVESGKVLKAKERGRIPALTWYAPARDRTGGADLVKTWDGCRHCSDPRYPTEPWTDDGHPLYLVQPDGLYQLRDDDPPGELIGGCAIACRLSRSGSAPLTRHVSRFQPLRDVRDVRGSQVRTPLTDH